MTKLIKALACISLGFMAGLALPSVAQEVTRTINGEAASPQPGPAPRLNSESPQHRKFDLDFPGGTAKELIDAVNLARGKPVNVVFPAENNDQRVPAFKVKQVDVAQLLRALYLQRSIGFMTTGEESDDSVWYFQSVTPDAGEARVCSFYSLAPYIDSGFTIDDITTAIQTGWRMAGISPAPQMSYHKETKLLIAVGKRKDIRVVEDVLKALNPSKTKTTSATPPVKGETKPE